MLLDDELIGYIFKFIEYLTECMNTNFMGVHEVFKPFSHYGLEVDWDLH